MLNRILTIFLVALVGANLFYGWHQLQKGPPDTSILDGDLAELQSAIDQANEEASQYSGGAILTQIEFRKSILQSTQEMLQQKKRALFRGITLNFVVDGQGYRELSPEKLSEITKDLEQSTKLVDEAQDLADQYSGGLFRATALMRAETHRVTQALLQQRYLAAKHGLAMLMPPSTDDSPNGKQPPVGVIVNDKDAL